METRLMLPIGKRLTFTFLFLLISAAAHTQMPGFWGMTSEGGADGVGTIFKTAADGTGHSVRYSFNVQNPGANPFFNSQLLPLANGKLYGVTYGGGVTNDGVLFEYDPATNVYTKKADFSNALGRNPMGKLELGANGKLYGMATAGGANNQGTIFEFDPATNVFSKKIDLAQTSGGSPYGNGLILHSNGKLYGTTPYGGTSGFGVLFEYDPATNTYAKKIDFSGTANGAYPNGNLMITSTGKIFGMTSQGGANNKGTLFEYVIGSNTLTKRFDFTTASGSFPYSSLTEGSNNLLYGVAPVDGTLFEFNPSTNVFSKKVNFNSNNTGLFPYGTPAKGINGKLYGTTTGGGATGNGVLYEYDIASNTSTVKYDFAFATGASAYGGLALAGNGNFYGVTYQGGSSSGQGVLYEYNPSTGIYTKKIELGQTPNGKSPYGGLTQAANKKLYGVTYQGGATNEGVLFEIDPITNVLTKKHDFTYNTGASPQGTLVLAANGNLYGMTSTGGATGDGVLFEFNPTTGSYVMKYEFDYDTGAEPNGTLILASNNKLYGTTPEGGTLGFGVLFEFDLTTGVYSKKAEFSDAVGSSPYDAMVEVSNGKFYGLCRDRGLTGTGLGTLFEFDLATNTITPKVYFNGLTGENPEGSLVKAPNGKLYGVTRWGGAYSWGVLFEYDPTTNTYTKKVDFGINGLAPQEPLATLALSSNGKLYGSTLSGGSAGKGVLFEFDPVANTLVKRHDFTGSNGASLLYGRLTFVKGEQTITFNSLAAKTVNDPAFSLTASASSLLPITYTSSNTAVATISGNTVTIVGGGTTTITASQAGDANFNPASSVTQTLTVNKLNQTITFNALATKNVGDANFTLNATTTSGLPIIYTSSNAAVATVASSTVTIVGGGTTTITASQPGDAIYNAAISVPQTLTVNKIGQTITFAAITDKTIGDATFAISATATSSLPVSFSTTSNKITISGSQVTLVSAGRATITAAQAGNTNFNAAPSVDRSFCIKPAKPTVTLSNPNTANPTLTSSANAGNQWFRNGTAIAGATGATYSVTQAGVYKVQVQVDDCISAFSDDQAIIVTGVEPAMADHISIYPNPANEEVTIDLGGFEKNTPVNISTIDLVGRSLSQLVGEGGREVKLDVRLFTPGRYVVLMRQGKNSVAKSFIKN